MCELLSEIVLPISIKEIKSFLCNKLQINQTLPNLVNFRWFNKQNTDFLKDCKKLTKINLRDDSIYSKAILCHTIKRISSLVKLTVNMSEAINLAELVHLHYLRIHSYTSNSIFNLQVLPYLENLQLFNCILLENINIIQGCTKLRKLFISDANGVLNWEILREAKQLLEL